MVLALIGLFQMKRDRSTLLYAILFGLLQQLAYIIFNIPSYHWYLVLPDFLIQLSALGSYPSCGVSSLPLDTTISQSIGPEYPTAHVDTGGIDFEVRP